MYWDMVFCINVLVELHYHVFVNGYFNILSCCISLESLDCINVFMRDCVGCDGVSLAKSSQDFLQQLIKTEEASYVDLRNYLFSRQCKLLLKLDCRAWEIAQRTLEFLHNIIHELAMDKLEVCGLCPLYMFKDFSMNYLLLKQHGEF